MKWLERRENEMQTIHRNGIIEVWNWSSLKAFFIRVMLELLRGISRPPMVKHELFRSISVAKIELAKFPWIELIPIVSFRIGIFLDKSLRSLKRVPIENWIENPGDGYRFFQNCCKTKKCNGKSKIITHAVSYRLYIRAKLMYKINAYRKTKY